MASKLEAGRSEALNPVEEGERRRGQVGPQDPGAVVVEEEEEEEEEEGGWEQDRQ